MINTLKTVKEFKDWLPNSDYDKHGIDFMYIYLSNYIDLLEQPLKLGMFIPCDEDDKTLDKPVIFYTEDSLNKLTKQEKEIAKVFNNKVKQYQQAEEKVLFEGGLLDDEFPDEIDFGEGKHIGLFKTSKIKDLLSYGFEIKLTDNFKKLITG